LHRLGPPRAATPAGARTPLPHHPKPPPASPQVGWKHRDAVAELEAKRKAKASKFYEAKKKAAALRTKAAASV
jgi:hypothetical protein